MNAKIKNGVSPTKVPMHAFSFFMAEKKMSKIRLGKSAAIKSFPMNPFSANFHIASKSGCSVVHFVLKMITLKIAGRINPGIKPNQKLS
jgi:hypothetical protein